MAAPPKPWEMAGVNNQSSANLGGSGLPPCCTPQASGMPTGLTNIAGATPSTVSPSSAPPPLPERPELGGLSSGYGGYRGGMMGGYGGYGSSMYGSMYGGGMGYGGYGGYGGGMYGNYGTGMYGGGYGMQTGYNPNSFIQQAEESSRQAFESVGSVVQVFGSVAMMLESTYQALYNSFRAVIGVADQLGRMKTHLYQIFSALAVIRGLKYLFKKLLVLLRLREAGLPEDVWTKAVNDEAANLLPGGAAGGNGKSSWPILIFFAIVFGGPWLIWRLLQSFGGQKAATKWADGSADHFLANAEYEFNGQGENELSFHRGQQIIIAPKELQPRMRGWLLASVDGKKEGIIPATYVKVLGKRKGRQVAPSSVSNQQPPVPPQQMNFSTPNPQAQPQYDPLELRNFDNDPNQLQAAFADASNISANVSSNNVDTCADDTPASKCGHCKD